MAENLPEPPTFDDFENLPERPAPAPVEATVQAEPGADAFTAEPAAEETDEGWTEAPVAEDGEPVAEGYAEAAPQADEHPDGEAEANDNPEAAFAAIQAAAEAAAADEASASGETGFAEGQADEQHEPAGEEPPTGDDADPRLAALGFDAESPFDATPPDGGETPFDGDGSGPVEEIPAIPDDAVAARLAGLVPGEGEPTDVEQRTTRVVVTGLISVASIASFKRSLGKIDGVSAVGVSSGPDGEFVFAVAHSPAIDLPQAVTEVPGFSAQVTSVTDDTVSVAARDPETES